MKTKVEDNADLRRYRTETPNTVVRGEKGKDLSVHAKWLYVYLKSVAGDSGASFQGTRTIAEGAGMSVGKVSQGKKELEDAGLIRRAEASDDDPYPGTSERVFICDIWPENMEEFRPDKQRSSHEHPRSSREQGCSSHESGCSSGEPKNKPKEEVTREEGRAREDTPLVDESRDPIDVDEHPAVIMHEKYFPHAANDWQRGQIALHVDETHLDLWRKALEYWKGNRHRGRSVKNQLEKFRELKVEKHSRAPVSGDGYAGSAPSAKTKTWGRVIQ